MASEVHMFVSEKIRLFPVSEENIISDLKILLHLINRKNYRQFSRNDCATIFINMFRLLFWKYVDDKKLMAAMKKENNYAPIEGEALKDWCVKLYGSVKKFNDQQKINSLKGAGIGMVLASAGLLFCPFGEPNIDHLEMKRSRLALMKCFKDEKMPTWMPRLSIVHAIYDAMWTANGPVGEPPVALRHYIVNRIMSVNSGPEKNTRKIAQVALKKLSYSQMHSFQLIKQYIIRGCSGMKIWKPIYGDIRKFSHQVYSGFRSMGRYGPFAVIILSKQESEKFKCAAFTRLVAAAIGVGVEQSGKVVQDRAPQELVAMHAGFIKEARDHYQSIQKTGLHNLRTLERKNEKQKFLKTVKFSKVCKARKVVMDEFGIYL